MMLYTVFFGRYRISVQCCAAVAILVTAAGACLGAAQSDSGSQARPVEVQSSPAVTARKASPNVFDEELRRAAALMGSGRLDEAAGAFRTVLAKAARTGDVYAQAQAHRGLGAILSQKGNFPAARAESEQSLSLFASIPDARAQAILNDQLGNISRMTGDLTAARAFYHRSLKAYDELGMLREKAYAMKNLAMANDPECERLIQESVEIARHLGDRNLQAASLHLLGDRLFIKGEFDAAEDRYNQAAAIYQGLGDRLDMARVLTSEGRMQRAHGHPEHALKLYQQALDLQQQFGDREGVIQSINAMGVAYENLNDYRKSGELYQRALALAKQTGSQMLIDFELGNLAHVYVDLGKDREAVEALEGLLRRGIDPSMAPYRYNSLSTAYFHLGRFHQSLEAASKSVEGARSQGNMDLLPGSLLERAQAELKLGDRAAAEVDADALLQASEELRRHLVPSDFMKRGFAERSREGFDFIINLLADAHQAGRAFEVAEQARSRAFLDLLASRDAQASPARQEQLAALARIRGQMAAQGIDPSRSQVSSTLGLVTRGESSGVSDLWNQWFKTDAELRSLVSVEPFSFKQLQATARRLNSTVLSYWVSPDATRVWVVAPSGALHSARVNVTSKRLQELIGGLWPGGSRPKRGDQPADGSDPPVFDSPGTMAKAERAAAEELTAPRRDGSETATRGGAIITFDNPGRRNWRELYNLLVSPVEHWLPSSAGSLLTIEPHGPLLSLPFAALKNAKGKYLLERFTLHYIPAISLLQFTIKKKQSVKPDAQHYLLIADPSTIPGEPGGRPLPALPGARREVSAVARLLPPSEVTLLEGPDAAEATVRDLSARSTVIHFATHGIIRNDHFATHGIIRNDQPFDSFLALAATGSGPSAGHLTAQKIYGLDIHADLVFLSACRSGLGKVSSDGMVGLTRAFIYAGVPSVIASLWDVADEPTYRLVVSFYRSWLLGNDKARALRTAQLRLLRQLRSGQVKLHTPSGDFALPENPVFWASFVLQGEP